ncbi:hypothetical protein G9A89_020286 [Geosiphon pyriformis]|nr:hypothetical protein G9A89_020286 [Geosiphon pyriformis]
MKTFRSIIPLDIYYYHNNNFKVATISDTATLEYYQSIYTHCKQRFNIPDGIKAVKKSVYQYIENCINNYLLGNYNISEVRSNFYNKLVHYSQLETEDLNSDTLATYFQELNFNIIKYCEETYPVQSQYSLDFESETETSNKGKNKVKQYSRTTPNTLTLPKTTTKHLQTPEQGTSVKLLLSITLFPISLQEPISTSTNIIEYLEEIESNLSENLESEETESEQEETTENEKEMATAYIAKIPEFTGEDNDTSSQEWLNKVQKAGDANGEVAAPRSNPSNNTILSAQIAQNANLSDIFPFEFEANKAPFLLSNAAVNEQKTITAMYTEATVEGNGSAGNIITYQLMQQFQKTVDKPAQTVIVIVKALVGNDWLLKTNANLDWKTQELKILYQEQYTIVSATCSTFNKQLEKAPVFEFEERKEMPLTEIYMALGSTFNWAEETKQEIFEESRRWRKVRYSTAEPRKQPPYIPLKCKDCNKKLSSMGACIFPEEEYETRTCYFCKACHKERFGYPKKNGKWDNTSCLTCGDILPEECNWIDVAMRGEVCDQTCQYALLISEKVRRGTPFDAAYNNALNKLYHYSHNAEMIFDLAITLINRATQEDVCQMKEAKYIEYTIELAGFDYKDEIETYHQIASHTYLTKKA